PACSADLDGAARPDRRVDRFDDAQIVQAFGARDVRLAVLEDAAREIVDLGSELIDRGKRQRAAARRAADAAVVESRLETEPAALGERAKSVQAVRVVRRRAVADDAGGKLELKRHRLVDLRELDGVGLRL